MATSNPDWKKPTLYGGYLQQVQQVYESKPVLRATLQLILSIFTVALFVMLAIRPTLGTITELLKKIEDQKKVNTQLDSKIAQLTKASSFLESQGKQIEGLLTLAIPDEPEVDKFSKMLEVVANETGVYLLSLDFQSVPVVGEELNLVDKTKPAGEDSQFVTFNLNLGGNSQQIEEFLKRVQLLEREVLISQVEVGKPKNNYKKLFPLASSVKGTIFYLPEQKDEAKEK